MGGCPGTGFEGESAEEVGKRRMLYCFCVFSGMGRRKAYSALISIPSFQIPEVSDVPISFQAKLVRASGSFESGSLAYKWSFVKHSVNFFRCGITIDISFISKSTSSSALAATWPFVPFVAGRDARLEGSSILLFLEAGSPFEAYAEALMLLMWREM